ncbi:MAG TPA: hypothetical protein VES36_10865 [Candidatus Limnocylindrales bacterium]|nr:hypothetical protein [Candidatus Limnocylindrales bacterium]
MSETAEEARREALALVEAMARDEPALVSIAGIDLAGALEQQLFFALRDGVPRPSRPARSILDVLAAARLVGAAAAASLGSWQVRPAAAAPIVILVRDPTHYAVVEQLRDQLARESVPVAIVRTGRAAASASPQGMAAPRLARLVDPRLVPVLTAFQTRVLARTGAASRSWVEVVGQRHAADVTQVARRELGRIALGAVALAGMVRYWRPGLLVAFDEIGTWARLLPAVGRRFDVPSLDLPHAEAADAVAMVGAGYDRMAVYGSRAADVLGAAGIAAERIVEIGAPRFDPLVAAVRSRPLSTGKRRIVYAAQYETGAMRPEVLALSMRAAMAVAGAVAPAELVIVPHPADPRPPATDADTPIGVEVRVTGGNGLHGELPGAWAMVTGWSNSVFEAAIAGVPSITVAPPGTSPVNFAEEGLAIAASDEASAAGAAHALLDPVTREATVARARAVLPERLGPLDGRSTERAAGLVLELVRGGASAHA